MPYEVRPCDGKYCVYKEDEYDVLGTHDTKEEAEKQIYAIEQSEQENTKAIKKVSAHTYSGYGILFNVKDLEGETFTADTHYGLDRSPVGMSVYYDHTLGGLKSKIGQVKAYKIDDIGILFEIELDRHHQYLNIVEQLIEAKTLGFSTGAMSHTVIRDGNEIKRWEFNELSLTPTPAEHKTIETIREIRYISTGDDNLETIEGTNEQGQKINDLEAKFNKVSEQLESILTAMQDAKPAKRLEGTLIAECEKHKDVKSFSDFLLAIQRGDKKRLSSVYKAMQGNEGGIGGYTVPEEFVPMLMRATQDAGVVEKYCSSFTMTGDTLKLPILKQNQSYTAGRSNYYGGVYFTQVSENGSLASADTKPIFEQLVLNAHKTVALTELTNELQEDSALALESIIINLFGEALAWQKDYFFLQGTGVGQPLGVFNSSAGKSVNVTDSNPTYDELVSMWSSLISSSQGKAAWFVHPTLLQHIVDLEADAVAFVRDMQGKPMMSFLGLPIERTTAMPSTVATGGIMVADFSHYAVAQKPSVRIGRSEDAGWDNDTVKWRVVWRGDGQPWLREPIYVGSATTMSAFVYTS